MYYQPATRGLATTFRTSIASHICESVPEIQHEAILPDQYGIDLVEDRTIAKQVTFYRVLNDACRHLIRSLLPFEGPENICVDVSHNELDKSSVIISSKSTDASWPAGRISLCASILLPDVPDAKVEASDGPQTISKPPTLRLELDSCPGSTIRMMGRVLTETFRMTSGGFRP